MSPRSVPSVPAAELREVTGAVLPTAPSTDTVLRPVLTAIAEVLHHISPAGQLNHASSPMPLNAVGNAVQSITSDESAALSAPTQHHPAPGVEALSTGNHVFAVFVVGYLPTSDAQGMVRITDGISAVDAPHASVHAPSAPCAEIVQTPSIAFPVPRPKREPLTTYLLGLQQRQPDLVLGPDTWAKLIGHSERELRRAMGSGALTWKKKARGRDHRSYIISVDALVTYATTIAAVWSGVMDTPEWWAFVRPKVAA